MLLSCVRQSWLVGVIIFSTRSFVLSSVIKLLNMVSWKRMDRFQCKLAEVVPPGQRHERINLEGQEFRVAYKVTWGRDRSRVNTVFQKRLNRLCCKLATSGPRTWAYSDLLRGSGGQRSRSSQEAEVRFGGLAEASFSTPLSRVGFLGCEVDLSKVMSYDSSFNVFIQRNLIFQILAGINRKIMTVLAPLCSTLSILIQLAHCSSLSYFRQLNSDLILLLTI